MKVISIFKKIIPFFRQSKTNFIPENAFITSTQISKPYNIKDSAELAMQEWVQVAIDPKTDDKMRNDAIKTLKKLDPEELANAFYATVKDLFKKPESGENTAGTLSSLGKNIHIVG